jgi:hypothetical protein
MTMTADAFSLPFASVENDFLRLDYLTTTGPRIIGLHVKGVEGNLLAETPDVHWATPHGEYYLRGGHRLWISPEDPFYNCPEENVRVITEKDKVTLRSNVDASGLEKEISFHLEKNRVRLIHQVTWHGREPIELAPWSITQLRLGGMAILPLSASESLQPNRNLVLWSYSQLNDERLELYDDLILLHGRAAKQAFKIGNYNSYGWSACLWDDALFVKHFSMDRVCKYPDMGSNVEAYVKDVCLELETLGPLTLLQPKESVTHEEIWEVSAGEYSTTLEEARIINKQLSNKERPKEWV